MSGKISVSVSRMVFGIASLVIAVLVSGGSFWLTHIHATAADARERAIRVEERLEHGVEPKLQMIEKRLDRIENKIDQLINRGK